MTTFSGRNARFKMGSGDFIAFSEGSWKIEGGKDMSFSGISSLRPKGGDNVIAQPTRRIMDHTRMRFDSMTIRQLWTRMGKMSKVDKLFAFAIVAEERGWMDLSIAAKARMASITGDSSILSGIVANLSGIVAKPKPKLKKGERLLRRMDG